MQLQSLSDFLSPVNIEEFCNDEEFKKTQIGYYAEQFSQNESIENADIILLGCNEHRGSSYPNKNNSASNDVRKQFYNLYQWHQDIKIADIGNIICGASLNDTYAALKTVIAELLPLNKRIIILGGSHDLTTAQYQAYADEKKIIEATVIDAKIDIDPESAVREENFLMDVFTTEPNFIEQYNHIGFQSYFVHPDMLETIDKLRFDCYRVGHVKEQIEEMEPVIRNSQLISFDISAIQNSHAPANLISTNGLTGEEACALMQYAGMSSKAGTIGIYGYHPHLDKNQLTAKQISQMLWYIMDGIYKTKNESEIKENENFNHFKMAFSEVEATFLQSKKTGRWWMQLPDGKYISCSQNDYFTACKNEIPERWMRAMERW